MGQHQQIPTVYENHLVALGRVLQTLTEEENPDVLIETTINYLQSEFEYRLIWIGFYDQLEHRVLGKGGVTPTGDTSFLKQKFFLNPGDLLEQIVIEQRPLGIPDLREEVRAGEWRRAAQEFGIQGTLLFPLRCKDRCFGVAMLGSHLWGISPRTGEKAQLTALFGALATALYQIQLIWQYSSTKRADQPLFQLLEQITNLPIIEQRLEAVVNMTQEFVATNRTDIYWYDSERRYFWHRVGNRQTVRSITSSQAIAGLTVQEATDFYQTLVNGQLVAIGSGRSPLKAEVTGYLLKKLRARSFLAAPIKVGSELVGFLAVEDNDARIWEEAEKNYVRAAAQIAALTVANEDTQTKLEQNQKDKNLIGQIAAYIADSKDTAATLKQCAELIIERFGAERLILLAVRTQETNLESAAIPYGVIYQHQPINRRPLTTLLKGINTAIFNSQLPAIAIEDWEQDSRLTQWRDTLAPLGVRSILVTTTNKNNRPGVLLVGHSAAHTWTHLDLELISVLGQQMSQLIEAHVLMTLQKQQAEANQLLALGTKTLLNPITEISVFERSFAEFLASLLSCPLVAILSWSSQAVKQPFQKLVQFTEVVAEPKMALNKEIAIHPQQDALIQEAIASPHFLQRRITDLPEKTRRWLCSTSVDQVLVMALHTPTNKPLGILLLADTAQRPWQPHLLSVVETLVRQFSLICYYRNLSSTVQDDINELEALNWYKHRSLQSYHQGIGSSVSALQEINSAKNQAADISLNRMRLSQIMHYMENTLASLMPILRQEQWQLNYNREKVSLANVLKRSLQAIESQRSQRQIFIQVHNPGQLHIYADRPKLECIIFELLASTCLNSQPGDKINIWCRPVETQLPASSENSDFAEVSKSLVEIVITEKDNRELPESAIHDSPKDSTSTLNQELLKEVQPHLVVKEPPSHNLKICQRIVRSWGGDLLFYEPENGKFISRLLLEISN